MPPIILHQYDLSPFCEKVRLAFGLKGMEWHAVETPIWPPKPDLVPLTGGRALPRAAARGRHLLRFEPGPARGSAGSRHPASSSRTARRASAPAVGWWAEKPWFFPAATLVTSFIGDQLPAEFVADRKAAMGRDFARRPARRAALEPAAPARPSHRLAQMLADGRPFLLGAAASAADLAAYHPLWFARQNGGPEVEALLPLAPLLD
ncbi:MAG: hypothetical protein U1E17_06020 [Geminicoccaceae bacterium]